MYNNYEEYMSSVLGYNINQGSTYYNYNYDNFSYDLEKKYPEIYKNLMEKIKKIEIQSCQNNFDEIVESLYKELKIRENTKDMKNMIIDLGMNWENFYKDNIVAYIKSLQTNPFELITLIIDLTIVCFLIYCFFRVVKGSRAWQLIKGIVLLIVATALSGLFNLKILNWILTGIMNLGVIAIIVIFQPELRRALEQLRNK